MKKQIIFPMLLATAFCLTACDNKEEKKEESGVKIEGSKGGGMEINKDKLQIQGKNGGELKMDSTGVKIKGKNDNK